MCKRPIIALSSLVAEFCLCESKQIDPDSNDFEKNEQIYITGLMNLFIFFSGKLSSIRKVEVQQTKTFCS